MTRGIRSAPTTAGAGTCSACSPAQLVGYSKVNGTKFEIAPDLATSLGEHNADFTTWTYKLKSGLKWSNGEPITPMDVKYGVERLFATDVINGGPSSYFTTTIDHPKDYEGPYKSGDLDSITTTDDSITFKLSSAYADWPYLMAMAASAPVPYKTEGGKGFVGATYTKHPIVVRPVHVQVVHAEQVGRLREEPELGRQHRHDPQAAGLTRSIWRSTPTPPTSTASSRPARTTPRQTFRSRPRCRRRSSPIPDLKKNADDPVTAFTRFFTVYPVGHPQQGLPSGDLLRDQQGWHHAGLRWRSRWYCRRLDDASGHRGLQPEDQTRTRPARTTRVTWSRRRLR